MSCTPSILRETSRWLVLDKPAGWHCVEAAQTDGAPTVVGWLRGQRPELSALRECGLAHRLDRDTSGCLLVAKSDAAQRELRDAIAGRGGIDVRKIYVALVAPGIAAQGEWTLFFSSRHRGSAKTTVRAEGEESQRGECRWRVQRAGAGSAAPDSSIPFDLIEVELIGPGRRHQIRAGFASLGHALAGDAMYGGAVAHDAGGVPIALALHAAELHVDRAHVSAPLPAWAS